MTPAENDSADPAIRHTYTTSDGRQVVTVLCICMDVFVDLIRGYC